MTFGIAHEAFDPTLYFKAALQKYENGSVKAGSVSATLTIQMSYN